MRALHRKLLRDLRHLRSQVVAIALVVACGVAVVVTTRTAYDSLRVSQQSYYAQYRFGDVFASLKRAPQAVAARLAEIPGVEEVRTRVVASVTLDVPGLVEPATGLLVSIPERRAPILNDVHVRRGRWVEPGARGEVIASEAFAEANGLRVGDVLGAVLNGRWERLRIVGIGLSPEFVYEIPAGGLFPDNRRFGVLWMSREALGPAFDMEGAFDDVVLALEPGAVPAAVIAEVDRVLEPWGGLGAFDRSDQVSHRFLSDEIAGNRVTGRIVPAVFLGVAAFLLNVVLSRLVATQRDQIAVLKAFGYANAAVGLHYLGFALAAVALGALLGVPVGLWWGDSLNEVYTRFYRFPVFRFEPGLGVLAQGIGVSALAAVAGAWLAVRRALALPPAEAMRPEAPARYRPGWAERLGLARVLTTAGRMIVRNLVRRPGRAALSTLGIALAVAILIVGRFFVDAVEEMADRQFRWVQRDDVTVQFHEPLPGRARFEVARLPGVMAAEPFRAVPARLRYGHRSERIGLLGLPPGAELRRPVEADLAPVEIPPSGVVLTTRLAELLGVGTGDALTVEVLEGERPVREVRVAALADELIGLSAYMETGALARLLREEGAVSGALLQVDPRDLEELYARLKRTPAVAGVQLREVALRSFEETLAESMGIMTGVLVVFACVIAVAVIYNAARIALSERGRELASLRVLGFTRREIAVMLLGEQAVLTVLAFPLGCAIGYGIAGWIAAVYQWELFRLPLVVSSDTLWFAGLVVAAAAALSALAVRRRLDRLDLVAVLKTRE